MKRQNNIKYYSVISGALCLLFISACSNTKLSQTWSAPDFSKSYNDIMIVGITESEQLSLFSTVSATMRNSHHFMSRLVQ